MPPHSILITECASVLRSVLCNSMEAHSVWGQTPHSAAVLLAGSRYGLLKGILQRNGESFRSRRPPSSPGRNLAHVDELTGLVEGQHESVEDLGSLGVLLNAVGLHVLDDLIDHVESLGRSVDLLPSRPLALLSSLLRRR